MTVVLTPAEQGWAYVRLLNYRSNTWRLMRRYDVVRIPPLRRWTFDGYDVLRRHEHYFNVPR